MALFATFNARNEPSPEQMLPANTSIGACVQLVKSGEVMGEHTGIHNFTVGQRKGLGVATGSPLYVIQIRGDKREVVVGSG